MADLAGNVFVQIPPGFEWQQLHAWNGPHSYALRTPLRGINY